MGFSQAELLEEVLVRPREAAVLAPDTQVIARPGWLQLITPSLPQGGLNEVALSVLSEADAERVIDETLAEYARLGLRFRWLVGPDSRPLDLGQRLLRRGLHHEASLGMARETTVEVGPDPAEVSVDSREAAAALTIEVVDEASVDLFSDVMAEGWSSPPQYALNRALLAPRAADGGARFVHFLGRYRGAAAAAASLCVYPRSAYLMGAVVLPAAQHRGLYRALVHARLRHAAARGIALCTSQSRKATSAPILAHLGFRAVCDVDFYLSEPYHR